MPTNSIPDDPPRIHLRAWLLAAGDPLRDLSLFDCGFAEPYEGSSIQAPATEQRQRTAHLVTPSAALRDLLSRCLRGQGLTPTETGDPDLVLLDLAAPDAFAHCRALREQHPDLPIVALTPLVSDHLAAWEAGANAVLPIPFDVSDLRDLCHVLLEDRIGADNE